MTTKEDRLAGKIVDLGIWEGTELISDSSYALFDLPRLIDEGIEAVRNGARAENPTSVTISLPPRDGDQGILIRIRLEN